MKVRESAASIEWRIGTFFLGAAFGLAGIFFDISWLVATALVVLLAGVVLRRLALSDSGSDPQEPTTPEP